MQSYDLRNICKFDSSDKARVRYCSRNTFVIDFGEFSIVTPEAFRTIVMEGEATKLALDAEQFVSDIVSAKFSKENTTIKSEVNGKLSKLGGLSSKSARNELISELYSVS